jgi:hypothetical protein
MARNPSRIEIAPMAKARAQRRKRGCRHRLPPGLNSRRPRSSRRPFQKALAGTQGDKKGSQSGQGTVTTLSQNSRCSHNQRLGLEALFARFGPRCMTTLFPG